MQLVEKHFFQIVRIVVATESSVLIEGAIKGANPISVVLKARLTRTCGTLQSERGPNFGSKFMNLCIPIAIVWTMLHS